MTDGGQKPYRRRILRALGLLGLCAAAFAVAFFDPSSTAPRVVLATSATALFLLDRTLSRREPRAPAGPPPVVTPGPAGLGLRSEILRRWPRIVGWLPGFRLARPDRLPERLSTFRGRGAELDELASALTRTRRVILHGMPGIGKSALAQELAHRVRHEFPDGQLYDNLGLGEERKEPSSVLKDFLKELGWPEREIPSDPIKRVNLFRTLTSNRRILVVLDAARDRGQLRDLLPGGPACAVVVTSRRKLSLDVESHSYAVEAPSVADATAILHAHSGRDPSAAPTHAASIVWSCGRLPRALVAAGALVRRSTATDGFAELAGRLADPEHRLRILNCEGIDLATDFSSEFRQLSAQEQRALFLLTLVESPTFVSWTLVPMMDIGLEEAEKLVTRLRGVQLLETASPTGPSRSRFHPLVREFVTALRDEELTAAELDKARESLAAAYLVVVREVLAGAEEQVRRPAGTETALLPPDYVLRHISSQRERWVRDEYTNLLQSADGAAPALAWRIARWLGDHVPRGVSPAKVRDTLEGIGARSGTPVQGRLWVLLALAGHATAIGDYRYAREKLTSVIADSRRHLVVAAVAYRRLAQLELAVGDRAAAVEAAGHAAEKLRAAKGTASRSAFQPAGEESLLRLALHRGRTWGDPDHWLASAPTHGVSSFSDIPQFLLSLADAEQARREERWDDARELLGKAYVDQRNDAFRVAAIDYERARVELSQARHETGDAAQQRIVAAIALAARSMLVYKQMGSAPAEMRGRCHLARALNAGGYCAEAARQAARVEADLRRLTPDSLGAGYDLLLARVKRARGEALLGTIRGLARLQPTGEEEHGEGLRDAVALLLEARQLFHSYEEWRATAELDLELSQAHRLAEDHGPALLRAANAYAAFEAAGDTDNCRLALREVKMATAQLNGSFPDRFKYR
ncbi:NB-ARC domain-containing protein [Paractinoplanes lichenicola]|uniref:NB-ARC domain-containing protein n=1 Tax=Paractinoplanes lichenicola TaxID=2802976 RepID=A0ABS1VT12_9ACTN|nr:NB-ARC domain-containing protein [Actinoplanes lichenicola]MBL7257609.1 hypothetical protein [Actinoplanes lichenicola]